MSTLVIVKHGSYLDVFNRIASGGEEYYHAERYWHDYVDQLAKKYNVTIIAIDSDQHDVMLPNGVRSIGVNMHPGLFRRISAYLKIFRLFWQVKPTHTVVRNPEPFVLWIALLLSKSLLPAFADSFQSGNATFKYGLLSRALKSRKIRYISNHNVPACLSTAGVLGVKKSRIIPWDWKYDLHYQPTTNHRKNCDIFKLFYVGRVTYGKGVGDLIDAVIHLNNPQISLTIVGDGSDIEAFKDRAKSFAGESIIFRGKVRNAEVLDLISCHDVVVVPSRREEAEGLPVTIYEALQSKIPIICSDHAMFAYFLQDGVDALFFECGNSRKLAAKIQELHSKPEIYKKLAANSQNSLKRIICPYKLDQIITNWLNAKWEWFEGKALSNLNID